MANNFTSAYDADVATSWALLYTGNSSNETVIHSFFIANIDGTNSADITISITNNAATDGAGSSGVLKGYIAWTVPVPADSSLILDKPVNVDANDKVWVKASVAGDLSVYASVLEMS